MTQGDDTEVRYHSNESTMANAARDAERRRRQTFAFADVGKRTFFEHGLPLVGSVRISPATEYDETFVGRQNGGAIEETAIRRLRAANRKEK